MGDDGTLNISTEVFPLDRSGTPIDPEAGGWNRMDGAAPLMPLLAAFPGLTREEGLGSRTPRHWDIGLSLDADSTIVLLDTTTGEREACWAELDHWSDRPGEENDSPEESRALMVWPSRALEYGRTYVVAIRGLRDDEGAELTPSEAFAALRDGRPSADPTVEARRERFESEVFAPLESSGVGRDSLQLAWQFTVGSRERNAGPLLAARDEAFRIYDSEAGDPTPRPRFWVSNVEYDVSEDIARRISGSFEVPLFLNSAAPGRGVRLNLDPSTGLPTSQGRWANWSFTVHASRTRSIG